MKFSSNVTKSFNVTNSKACHMTQFCQLYSINISTFSLTYILTWWYSFEMLVTIYQSTWSHTAEDWSLTMLNLVINNILTNNMEKNVLFVKICIHVLIKERKWKREMKI
jgi:hypothetical protein